MIVLAANNKGCFKLRRHIPGQISNIDCGTAYNKTVMYAKYAWHGVDNDNSKV